MAQRHLTPLTELVGELSDDLLEAATVPTWLEHVTHLFGVAALDAHWSEGSVVYEGTVSPMIPDSWLELPLGPVALRFLGGADGMPFTLGVTRKKGSAGTDQAPILQRDVASTDFELQVRMPALELIITDPKVKPATLKTEPHYILEPSGGAAKPTIRLPHATLVVASDKRFFLSTNQSWEDLPAEAADALIPLGLEPRYVLFNEHFGMGLSGLTIDLSTKRSTAALMGKPGYGAKWRGVSVDEALMLFLIGSPETSLAVHGQDMVFGEGGVSGRFLAEFAKDHPLDDGRVKVDELKLVAHDVSPPAPLTKLLPQDVPTLEMMKDRPAQPVATPTSCDAYFSRHQGPESNRLRLGFRAAGAKKNAKYQVRVGGKVVASGDIAFQKQAGGVHPSVAVETKDLSLPEGEHHLVLDVYEALPVSSGTQRVIHVDLDTKGKPETALPVPSLEAKRGSGGEAVPAVAGFVDGEVPLALRGSVVFGPIGDEPELAWKLRERGKASPLASGSGQEFTHTLSAAGQYELELLYKHTGAAGQWVRSRVYAVEAYAANPYATAARPVVRVPEQPSFEYPDEVPGPKLHLSVAPDLLTAKLTALTPAPPTTSVFDLQAHAKVSVQAPSPSRHEHTVVVPTQAEAYVARVEFEIKPRQLTPTDNNGIAPLTYRAMFTSAGGQRKLSAAARAWIEKIVAYVHAERHRPKIRVQAYGERPTRSTTAALQTDLDALVAGVRAGLIARGWVAQPGGTLAEGGRSISLGSVIEPGNTGLSFFLVAPQVIPVVGTTVRRVAYVNVSAALAKTPVEVPKAPVTHDPPRGPGMFRYPWFRRLRVDLKLHRNVLTRGMLEAVVDLHEGAKRALPEGQGGESTPGMADPNGLTRIPLVFTQDPATGRMRGEAALVADPRDEDGLRRFVRGKDAVAPWINPLFAVLPPMVALGGSNFAAQAGLAAGAAGLVALLEAVGYLKVPTLQFQGVRVRYDHLPDEPTTWAVRAATDYQVELEVDFKPLKMKTSKPIAVNYRDVGLVFGGEHGLAFDFDPKKGLAVDVADEGLFKLPEPLGSLLTVTFVRLGIGSPLSVSVGLRLNLALGAFKISRFQGKLSFDPEGGPTLAEQVKFSVSPIRVAVDVKDLMKGAGLVEIGDSGFSAGVDLTWLKPKMRLAADFAYQKNPEGRHAVYAAVFGEWAAAIPLGGAGLYGLGGLFGMNFVRKQGDDAFAWYAHEAPKANVQSLKKWEVKFDGADRFAVGLGAVLGTLGDGGRAFNAKGVLLVEVPGPRILLFMRANLLTKRPKLGGQGQGTILAVLDLDFVAKRFLIQLQVDYQIPKVLKVIVPAEVFFDLADPSNFHIYLGRDKPATKRITIKVFDFIDAWGYLMIDGQGIPNLANTGRDLRGFSVAMGFRSELTWGSKAANLYLTAFVEAHVGLGTDPVYVYGKLALGGELMLLIIGVGVRAELALQAGEGIDWSLEGKICGKVRLLFWEVEGCIDFALGPAPALPEAQPAVEGLALVDPLLGTSVSRRETNGEGEKERAALRGLAVSGSAVDWASAPEVAIDTIPVLEFRPPMNGAPAGSLSFAESHTGTARETLSDDYFSTYALRELEVFETVEGQPEARLSGLPGVWLADTHTLAARPGE
ncbi:hypothetical protein PPSIR1_15885, partial [Plesiocystis pacifica SIR-1]